MATWHTNADLYHQWEEAESRAERWEKTAKEERKRHEWELTNIKAEIRQEMTEMRRELEGQIESITQENKALREEIRFVRSRPDIRTYYRKDANKTLRPDPNGRRKTNWPS